MPYKYVVTFYVYNSNALVFLPKHWHWGDAKTQIDFIYQIISYKAVQMLENVKRFRSRRFMHPLMYAKR